MSLSVALSFRFQQINNLNHTDFDIDILQSNFHTYLPFPEVTIKFILFSNFYLAKITTNMNSEQFVWIILLNVNFLMKSWGLVITQDNIPKKKYMQTFTMYTLNTPQVKNYPSGREPGMVKEHRERLRQDFPFIPDLHKLTDPFKNHRCLVTLHNFLSTNILNLGHPILLKSPAPIIYKASTSILFWSQTAWAPANIIPQNNSYITIGTNFTLECSSSKFLVSHKANGNLFRDFCLQICFFKFVSGNKPWNCRADIFLFPPSFITTTLTYPQLFYYEDNLKWPSAQVSLQSHVSHVSISVQHSQLQPEWGQSGTMGWMKTSAGAEAITIPHHLYFIVDIDSNSNCGISCIREPFSNPWTLFIFRMCYLCAKRGNIFVNLVHMSPFHVKDLSSNHIFKSDGLPQSAIRSRLHFEVDNKYKWNSFSENDPVRLVTKCFGAKNSA